MRAIRHQATPKSGLRIQQSKLQIPWIRTVFLPLVDLQFERRQRQLHEEWLLPLFSWVLRIYEWNFQHENQAYPLETENGYKDRSGRMPGHFPKMFMDLKCSFPTDTACKPSGCLLHWLVASRQFESWSKRKERNRSVTTCRACYCRA